MKAIKKLLLFTLIAALFICSASCNSRPDNNSTTKEQSNPPLLSSDTLIQAQSDTNSLRRPAATFLLWQTMYQEAYYEWCYISWGLREDTYGITKTYSSAASYGIAVASTYTKDLLHEGIESIADYLTELVAGADAATRAGLEINNTDMKDVEEIKTWIKNVYLSSGYMGTYRSFLEEFVGNTVTEYTIEDAAKLVVLYTKYCHYVKYNAENDFADEKILEKATQEQLEMSETPTVYGGYLLYESEAAAQTALTSLRGKTGFELWHSFAALERTNGDLDSITNATVETDLLVDDTALEAWLFDDARKTDDLSVVAGKDGYYLLYFHSATVEWKREALDLLIADHLTQHLEELVQNGGYILNTALLK